MVIKVNKEHVSEYEIEKCVSILVSYGVPINEADEALEKIGRFLIGAELYPDGVNKREVEEVIRILYNDFVKKNGHNPMFAIVRYKYLDDGSEYDDLIKLTVPENPDEDPDDDYVLFYVDGLDGLLEINKGCEDFIITDIQGFTDEV